MMLCVLEKNGLAESKTSIVKKDRIFQERIGLRSGNRSNLEEIKICFINFYLRENWVTVRSKFMRGKCQSLAIETWSVVPEEDQ